MMVGMKPDIHPAYRPVVFRDRAGNFAFLTRSTMTSDKTVEWEDRSTALLHRGDTTIAVRSTLRRCRPPRRARWWG
jgi:ribosomal protein L31